MDLTQLKTLKTVAKTLNFTRAAEELGVTQPAVSHQIKSLEEELGEILFIRDRKKISLSEQGAIVLEYAKKMLGQVELMRREIGNADQEETGNVRLVAITRALGNPFPELRQAWIDKDTGIDVSFTSAMDSESIIESVRRGEADIGFSTLTDDFSGLLSIPYGNFELALVVSQSHKLAGTRSVQLSSLRDKDWILFEQGSWIRRETDKIFERHSFTPLNIYESNDGTVIKELVISGEGISLLPAWGVQKELDSGELVIINISDARMTLPIRLILQQDERPEAVNLFADFLLQLPLNGIHLGRKNN